MSSWGPGRWIGWVGAAALLIGAPLLLNNVYWTSILILIGVNILLTASLRTVTLVGHFSLGHVGFMLLGAYTSGLLMMKAHLSFWPSLLAGGLLPGVMALALGYPFLRVKGIYFAILTLLTAETFRLVAYNWRSLTGGSWGLVGIPGPGPLTIPGLCQISFETPTAYYYLTLGVVCLCLLILYRLEHSRLGFKWRSIHEAERLAESVGVNVLWYKVFNFSLACFFAGVAGSLFVHFQRGLSADASSTFGVLTSIYLLVYMVVGGEHRFAGPLIGVVVLLIVGELDRPLEEYQPMMIGAVAIVVVMLLPGGIMGLIDLLHSRRLSLGQKTKGGG